MVGENVEILRLAASTGSFVGFVLSRNRPKLYGKVLMFNDFTGRIFVEQRETVDNFLIREVRGFEFPKELWREWIKSKGVSR